MDNKQELLEAACRTFNTFTSPSRQFVHKVQFYINWSTLPSAGIAIMAYPEAACNCDQCGQTHARLVLILWNPFVNTSKQWCTVPDNVFIVTLNADVKSTWSLAYCSKVSAASLLQNTVLRARNLHKPFNDDILHISYRGASRNASYFNRLEMWCAHLHTPSECTTSIPVTPLNCVLLQRIT